MKKNIALSVSLIFGNLLLFSQAKEEVSSQIEIENTKHRISLQIGGSSPSGEFAETDITAIESGFANGGVNIALLYQRNIDENFSITFCYGGQAFDFDNQSFADALNQNDGVNNQNYLITSDPYAVGNLLIGVKGAIGNQFKGYLNPQFGLGSMIQPNIDILITSGSFSQRASYNESEVAGAFMLGIAFGAEARLSKLISLGLDFNYLTADFDIEYTVDTIDSNGQPVTYLYLENRPFSSFTTSINIGFNF